MHKRGNKPAGILARIIFALIVAMVAVIIWLGVRGFQKEPQGPPPGSQSIPAQAAHGAVQAAPPETRPTH